MPIRGCENVPIHTGNGVLLGRLSWKYFPEKPGKVYLMVTDSRYIQNRGILISFSFPEMGWGGGSGDEERTYSLNV